MFSNIESSKSFLSGDKSSRSSIPKPPGTLRESFRAVCGRSSGSVDGDAIAVSGCSSSSAILCVRRVASVRCRFEDSVYLHAGRARRMLLDQTRSVVRDDADGAGRKGRAMFGRWRWPQLRNLFAHMI